MPDIRADLSAISKEIRNIEGSAKAAATETRNFKEDLKFNPSSIKTVESKFVSLNAELDENVKLLAEIKKAQQKETDLKGKYGDEKSIRQIETALDKLAGKYAKVEQNIKRLKEQLSDQRRETELLNAATAKYNEHFGKLESTARRASIAVAALVGVMARLTSEMMKQGTELTALSTRYGTSVEELQRWNYALQSATGQQDLYTNSLSVLSKGMAEIASGRGIAYEQALNNIGLSYAKISGMSMDEKFEAIVNALKNTTNASERAAAAQKLLGDSGMTIAGIFDDENNNLDEYISRANDINVITTQQAEALKEAQTQWSAVKLEMQAAYADVVVALAPALQTIADILTDFVAPALQVVANWFTSLGKGGQTFMLVILGLIIALPKIVALFKSFYLVSMLVKSGLTAVNASATVLNATTGKWQLILLGIVTVIMAIVSLISMLTGKADEANRSLERTISNAQNAFGIADTELTSSTETYSHSENTLNLNVDVYGHGDTEVGDENAVKIANLTIDGIQKRLGELIK